MAGKILAMSKVKQALRLRKQGYSKNKIYLSVEASKNTVKGYLRQAKELNEPIDELLKLEDHELERKLHAGNPAYKEDERYEQLKPHLDYYARELKRTGVTRKLLWEEYRQSFPNGYSYTQFCFHIQQYRKATNPSMALHHEPGEKLFVDFAGKKLSYTNLETGELIECEVFIACMPYSDYAFAMAIESQQLEDFIFALVCCLHALGGVPVVLVPDNLKSAIVKADRYEPDVNTALDDFANHYGMSVVPARSGKPKDKALAENQVQLIYSRVYARLRDEQFFSLGELNKVIREKTRQHNQTRMQLKPYCREEEFVAEEKTRLMPLPEQDFEIKHYKELKVAKNNHIRLYPEKHYYSVPYQYTGRKVKVVYTRSLVRIFRKQEQIAVHTRSCKPGQYTSVKDHLYSQHQHYLDRSPDYYIRRASKTQNASFHELVKCIFNQNRIPEQLYRTCDGLFSLYRKNDTEAFDKACRIAIDYERYSYGFIKNLLENKASEVWQPQNEQETPDDSLPAHGNVRGKDYYKQSKLDM